MKTRCEWAISDPLMQTYHDEEWGTPQHDDRALFELLILEGAQAGLSWITVLKKRANYREAFDQFKAAKIARYDQRKINALLANAGIIRNRLKIASAIQNAKAFLDVQDSHGSFDAYIWQFVDGKPKRNAWKTLKDLPCNSAESDAMSRDLRARGFAFVGPTICYSFMQATGLVNDHIIGCWRYNEVQVPESLRVRAERQIKRGEIVLWSEVKRQHHL